MWHDMRLDAPKSPLRIHGCDCQALQCDFIAISAERITISKVWLPIVGDLWLRLVAIWISKLGPCLPDRPRRVQTLLWFLWKTHARLSVLWTLCREEILGPKICLRIWGNSQFYLPLLPLCVNDTCDLLPFATALKVFLKEELQQRFDKHVGEAIKHYILRIQKTWRGFHARRLSQNSAWMCPELGD